jgi:hypothetical protein
MPSLPGAVKADLFPGLPPRPPAGPLPEVTATALPAIDAHFWDWTLWLGAKRQRGRDALVAAELAKMGHYLLEPLGAAGLLPPRPRSRASPGALPWTALLLVAAAMAAVTPARRHAFPPGPGRITACIA